jgi:hypothetical protein
MTHSIRPLLKAADRAADPGTTIRDMVSLIEQTVNDIARLTRSMTTATPERRRFREDVEDAFKRFIESTGAPESAAAYAQPETTLLRIYGQSVAASAGATDPKSPAADRAVAGADGATTEGGAND